MDKKEIKNKFRVALLESTKRSVAGGVLIKCDETDNIFLMLRSEGGVGGKTWSLLAGGIEDGETVLEGLKREVGEEIQIDPSVIDFKFVRKEYNKVENLDFHYYEGFTKKEFKAILNEENLEYGWFSKDKLPTPLYPKLREKIDSIWEN